ncbi:hypothetical protein LUZ62_061197 [Rhynchospora pubera]|uniref:Reverse transcriptase domain-containing protein n=1 Tax=Rhynchospora pubera TaxID=906938 RepID=A0AAV8EBJ4_9POAL|nr:hypothetical protein LUZ62_061197 [Rhynchospora pubera]
MNLLAWNCCGSGGHATIPNLARYLHATRAKIAFISETRANVRCSEQRIRRLPLKNSEIVPAVGKWGGLWLLWDDEVSVTILERSHFFLFVVVREHPLAQPCTLGAVYGDPHDRVTEYIWERVEFYANEYGSPLCIFGDLNSVVGLHEKFGGSAKDKRKHKRFRSMINRTQLVDLGYHGCAYTWSNHRPCATLIQQRLDRAMASTTWVTLYPEAKVYHLPKANSDHVPILLCTKPDRERGLRTFKAENWWLHAEGFDEVCKRALVTQNLDHSWDWEGMQHRLKNEVKGWLKTTTQPSHELALIEAQLLELQYAIPDDSWHDKFKELQSKYNHCLLLVEAYWAQRSRIRWAVEGDNNTAFFHATVASRRRRNSIHAILGEGDDIITDRTMVRRAFVEHYKNIFISAHEASTGSPAFSFAFVSCLPELNPSERELLGIQPTEQEITAALFAIHPDRASGLDGMNGRLVQRQWEFFRPYVLNYVTSFFATSQLDPKMARANVVLVPKKEGPKHVSDYRPISVCNLVYKIISKILSTRMKPIMSKLVTANQCAFVPGRIISDNILLLRELMHTFSSSSFNRQAFCFKCDLSKAFDRMEWHFVVRVLQLYGFPPIFVSWINVCISSASFAILINGSADGFITPTRGLRQGCALSPYLFILCMDVLNRMLDYKVHSDLIRGLTISRNAPPITTILYDDDLLVCGLAEQQEVQQVKDTVEDFCAMSGQKIGIEKSRIWFSKRTGEDMKQYCMQMFEATQGENDHTYLGVPIMPTRISHYDYLIDKVTAKLHVWKAKLLSPAAKITLIKAVVEPMVLYSMGAGPITDSVLQRINLKVRAFFWNTGEKNRMRLVNWDKITVPKAEGGLGLRGITLLNKAMAMKMLWRLVSKECEQSLWVRVLNAKYLSRTCIWLATVPTRCTKLWVAILQAREALRANV